MKDTIFFASNFILTISSLILSSSAGNTVSLNSRLIDGETLISPGKIFELGFFTPDGRSDNNRYVGIWYYNLSPRTVVWVANRETPVRSTGGNLTVENGNLKIFDKSDKIWSTDLETESYPRFRVTWEAILMDSGNLVLRDNSGGIIWESFKHPTDTFLLGMKMDQNLTLTSWKSQADPARGNFTFELDKDKKEQFIIKSGVIPYWKSGDSGSSDIGVHVPTLVNTSRGLDYASYYNNTRVTLNFEGRIQYLKWDVYQDLNLQSSQNKWQVEWSEPRDSCSINEFCGSFGSCNINGKTLCKCLPGFTPKYAENWEKGKFSDGCIRNSATCGYGEDMFLKLRMMKVDDDTKQNLEVENETECRDKFLENCQYLAYSYSEMKNNIRDMEPITRHCSIWINDLINLQEEYSDGKTLFVRVSRSDIETTTRNCEACGTNAIPYPLSTGINCGDPSYFSFFCNNYTDKLSFVSSGVRYNVTSVNPSTRTFVVQAKESEVCNIRNRAALQVDRPFNVTNTSSCGAETESNISEIQISWDPPLEPRCNTSADCKDWPNTTCNPMNGTRRCFCNTKFQWDGIALKCTSEENQHKQVGSSPIKERPLVLIIGPIIAGVVIISCAAPYIFLFIRRRMLAKKQERTGSAEGNTAILYSTENRVKELINSEDFTEDEKKRIDVPFFSLPSILAATDNFSASNKLGRGGFGPVYKGIFPGGQEIAIKRLSKLSKQGLEEFKNEIVLIARLQHRNLVRLLGYCIQGEEKILLYEFMLNKSLDLFIFDENLRTLLNWEKRFDIILGTARGLLYLHQDSRLRIIHRDMKTSNILLDSEMNPKISDFGMARIFEGKQMEGATNRVVGTFGYMSPEYALDGLFSVKSDVFSFGVVILEIVSGRRNTGVFETRQALNLLSIAWRLWSEDKAMEFMDEILSESYKINEFLKCFHTALLCVQEFPADRPTMSDVVVMLSSNDTSTFPVPKKSAFIERGEHSDIVSSSS